MKVIGITGPSGSGKSLLSDVMREQGYTCIDADEVYHSLLVPPSACLDGIREAFGGEVFLPDGTLCRESLAKIVFSDSEKLELLNQTVLCHVVKRICDILTELERGEAAAVGIDAPTLIESGLSDRCTVCIAVFASPETRIQRIVARDKISRERAAERTEAQKSESFYRQHCTHLVYNDGSENEFRAKAKRLISDIIHNS